MSINRIYNEIKNNETSIITKNDLREYSRKFHYRLRNVIQYLSSQNAILKLFADLYYIKDEETNNLTEPISSFYKLIGDALEYKGIENWYFGLYTALELGGYKEVSEENDKDIYIICKRQPVRENVIECQGFNLKFIRLRENFFTFGIIKDGISYSDYERTLLDFVMLWKRNRKHTMRIIGDLNKLMAKASVDKIKQYLTNYPIEIKKVMEEYFSR